MEHTEQDQENGSERQSLTPVHADGRPGEGSGSNMAAWQHGSMNVPKAHSHVHGGGTDMPGPSPALPHDFQFPLSNPLVGLSPPRMPSPSLARKIEQLESASSGHHTYSPSRMGLASISGPEPVGAEHLKGPSNGQGGGRGSLDEEQHVSPARTSALLTRASYEDDAEVLGTSLGALLLPPELPAQLAAATRQLQTASSAASQPAPPAPPPPAATAHAGSTTSGGQDACASHAHQREADRLSSLPCATASPSGSPHGSLQHTPAHQLPFISFPLPASMLPFTSSLTSHQQPAAATTAVSQPGDGTNGDRHTWQLGVGSTTDQGPGSLASPPIATPPSPSAMQAAGAAGLLSQQGWRERWEHAWGPGSEGGASSSAPWHSAQVRERSQHQAQPGAGRVEGLLDNGASTAPVVQTQSTRPRNQTASPSSHLIWQQPADNQVQAYRRADTDGRGPGGSAVAGWEASDMITALDMGALQARQKGRGGSRPEAAGLWWSETITLFYLSLPCIIIAGAPQVFVVSSQVFAGHLDTDALAAAALANTLWSLMYYIVIGTSTALETLGAQAAGARDKSTLVVWGMAAGVVMTLLGIAMAGALWHAGPVVAHLFRQDAAISHAVARFCRGLVPGLLPQVWAVILAKHLQAQSHMGLPALVCALGVLANVGLSYKLVLIDGQGLEGVPIAASWSRVIMCVGMLLAVIVFEARQGTEWLSSRTWMRGIYRWHRAKQGKVLWRFLALGAPGGLMMGLECAAFEVTTAMAGYLGALQVAAHASAFSLGSLAFMCVPIAISIATGIRVASLLGAGQAAAARTCAASAVVWGTAFAAALGAALWVKRDALAWLFTGSVEGDLVELVKSIAPLVAVCQVLNGARGSSQGVLRGCGRQGQLLVHNVMGFGGGVALGYWLTFGKSQMGLVGLWLGILAGVTLVAILNIAALTRVDWSHEVRAARMVRALRDGSRMRRGLIEHALQADVVADEALVEALLEEAQQDPRPLHIIYQGMWTPAGEGAGGPQGGTTDSPSGRSDGEGAAWQMGPGLVAPGFLSHLHSVPEHPEGSTSVGYSDGVGGGDSTATSALSQPDGDQGAQRRPLAGSGSRDPSGSGRGARAAGPRESSAGGGSVAEVRELRLQDGLGQDAGSLQYVFIRG